MKSTNLFCLILTLIFGTVGLGGEPKEVNELNKALLQAAADGNFDEVKSLLSQGADVNSRDAYGLTPLHIAVKEEHKSIVDFLLARGARVGPKDNAGRTPLHYGAGATVRIGGEEQVDIIDLLLSRGANINDTDNLKWTPLHYAAYRLRKSTVELLVRRGADLNIEDKRGRTAFLIIKGRPTEFRGLEGAEPYLRKIREINDFMRGDGHAYYVSPSGDDSSSGLLHHPFRTLSAAISFAEPGDTIFVRSGVYHCLSSICIDKSGEQNKPICLSAYPGEKPVFDFSQAREDGIYVTGAYWHIKELTVTNAYGWGIRLAGQGAHHNILEHVVSHSNSASGITLMDGPTHNLVLNCDSFRNFDPQFNGENASGFGANRGVGRGNIFIGCRAWNNSDNGFEFWQANESVRLEKCYACRNGENIWNHPTFTGNGTGFKLGMGEGKHVLIHCVAWDHYLTGFPLNSNTAGAVLYNCTAWRNSIDYRFLGRSILANNISHGGRHYISSQVDAKLNSWDTAVDFGIDDDDFLSFDDSVITGPRNPDGSIPESDFLKLVSDSDAIDAGTNVGLPFSGKASDLGAFEYDPEKDKRQSGIKWLHQAVRDHDIAKIQSMLSEKADVNEKDCLGYAPLHWACYFGYTDAAEILLNRGANPNLISDTGRTPLEISKAMDYEEIAELFRKNGAQE